MSTTRRANKRKRDQRRAENDAMRTARRDSLAVLLSRAQRGVPLSTDEAALLRAAVEAEIREGDAARTSERGQQRAMEQQRQRVEAAEAAIIEAEDAADRHKAEYLSACGTIAAMHAAATGQTGEGPVRGVVEDVADIRARMLAAEQRLARLRDMADAWKRRLPATIRTATAADAVRHAADGDDRPVMFAVTDEQQSTAEERAEALLQRAERAEQDRAALATELQAVRARAQEAEEQAATQLNRARMWRQKAIETDDRADRFEAAWHSARRRASVHAQHVERLKNSNKRWYSNATAERRRAVEAERSAKAWEDTARQYATNMDDARHDRDTYRAAWHSARDRARKANRRADLADAVTAETKQLKDRRTTTLRARAQRAEAALDRVRAVGPQLEYDATAPGKAEAAREAFRDASRRIRAALAAPEVITDRATIRNTLAEPEPAPLNHPIPLAQPCASCGHARNHHPFGGPCCVGNTESKCGCAVFTVTADSIRAQHNQPAEEPTR